MTDIKLNNSTLATASGSTITVPHTVNFTTGTFAPQLVKIGETGPIFADNTYSIQEGFYQKMDNPKCFITEDESGNYREVHYLLESQLRRNDEEITRKAKEIGPCLS